MDLNLQRSTERLLWIDNLKAVGILLVVFAHNKIDPNITRYIYAFHMPLFFFISGVLYSGAKYSYQEFIKRKVLTRIKPYFVLSFVTYLFWICVVLPLSVRGQAYQVDKMSAFTGIFYGIGEGVWRNQMATALWFLPCLFCVEVIYDGLKRLARNNIVGIWSAVIFLVMIGALLGHFRILPWRLPWSFDMALTAVFFYAAGHLFSGIWQKLKAAPWTGVNIIAAVIVFIFGLIFSDLNGRIDMSSFHMRNPMLFVVTPFCFILPMIYIVRNIKVPGFDFLGRNTLPILAYHFIALFMIRSVIYLLAGELQPFENLTLTRNALLVSVEFLVLYPIIIIHNKMLGRFMA